MIKIGLDVATTIGACVVSVNDNKLEKVLFLSHSQIYYKNDLGLTIKNIRLLVNDICELIHPTDDVIIGIELNNYGGYNSVLFSKLTGMLEIELLNNLVYHRTKIVEFHSGEWHKQLKNEVESKNIDFSSIKAKNDMKKMSIAVANSKLPYQITSDDEADAFNIAMYVNDCRSQAKIHEDIKLNDKAIKNKEHKLFMLSKSYICWDDKYKSAIEKYKTDNKKSSLKRAQLCETKMKELKEKMKGGVK